MLDSPFTDVPDGGQQVPDAAADLRVCPRGQSAVLCPHRETDPLQLPSDRQTQQLHYTWSYKANVIRIETQVEWKEGFMSAD